MISHSVQKHGATRADVLPRPVFVRSLRAEPITVRKALVEMHDRLSGVERPDLLGRLELVLAEVMNNIVRHGGGETPGRAKPTGKARGAASARTPADAAESHEIESVEPGETGPGPGATEPGAPGTIGARARRARRGPACRVIHLSVACHDRGVACAVTDDGIPLPLTCLVQGQIAHDAFTPVTDLPEGGFGWLLIRDLTQALTYFRDGDQNLLVFNIPRNAEPN